ncbi:hypothetical protein PROFUN_14162, partial [Planoprotostelium fungivorum]
LEMNLFAWPSPQMDFGLSQHSGTNLSRLRATHTCFTLRATSALSLLLDRDLALRIARPFLLVYQPGTLNWP